jgi:hypothetical protein
VTVRKRRVVQIERGSTRPHRQNSLWKTLWTCRKTERNEWHWTVFYYLILLPYISLVNLFYIDFLILYVLDRLRYISPSSGCLYLVRAFILLSTHISFSSASWPIIHKSITSLASVLLQSTELRKTSIFKNP